MEIDSKEIKVKMNINEEFEVNLKIN